jgi:hypothetical protein
MEMGRLVQMGWRAHTGMGGQLEGSERFRRPLRVTQGGHTNRTQVKARPVPGARASSAEKTAGDTVMKAMGKGQA